MKKNVLVCVEAVVWKNKFMVQFEDRRKIDMSFSWWLYVYEKKEIGIEADEDIYDLTKIGQGELLTLNGVPFCEGDWMF